MAAAGFTVAAVCYGDNPSLARRCLGSVLANLDPSRVASVRVGLNDASPLTRGQVLSTLRRVPPEVEALVYDCGPHNRLKYPLMRKLLYDRTNPVVTPFLTWFDDDSCLAPGVGPLWWSRLHVVMQQADVAGSLYRIPLRGGQAEAIRAQPWYDGKPLGGDSKVTFPTGGWWCARTRLLQRWDYPFPAVSHNGGDVMLGELCRQRELRLANFAEGVWVNADERGNRCKAARRGVSRPPVWSGYSPDAGPPDLSHNAFEVTAVDPRGR